MSIWWSEFQAARKSWRCWLVDTPTPPAIISPSSGPDKDLDITDGVESWECSVFTVWPVVLAELSWAAEQDKNNPPVPVSVYQYPSMSRALKIILDILPPCYIYYWDVGSQETRQPSASRPSSAFALLEISSEGDWNYPEPLPGRTWSFW